MMTIGIKRDRVACKMESCEMILLKWFQKRWRTYAILCLLLLSFNLYFIFLMRTTQVGYLLYLDLLLLVFLAAVEGTAFFGFWKSERRKKRFLQEGGLIGGLPDCPDDREVFGHDLMILEKRLQEKFAENCDLQDYVARWCHEFKIPLSAALLISDKIRDADIRTDMREQLERMNWQMNMMLQGCRLQGALFDMQVRQVSLEKCVRESIRNNQFFLIQKKFQIDLRIEDITAYTDEVWLTYILDQILNNAVKYAKTEGEHHIRFWTEKISERTAFLQTGNADGNFINRDFDEDFDEVCPMKLFIEDNGEGIRESDIRRVFEKGYTGSNYHNGKYKSTGMGLYMADKIAGKMGHRISVESCYGEYTRFGIAFRGKQTR